MHVIPSLRRPPALQLAAMARDPYAFLDACHARLGDLFVLRLPGLPALHVCADPDGVRQLVTASYDTGDRFGGGAEYFLDRRALICLDGEEHRHARRILNPLFTAERLRSYGTVMQEVTEEVLATFRPGSPIVLQEAMGRLTLRVMIRCIFGVAAGPRTERLCTLLMSYLDSMFQPWMFALNMALGSDRLRALIGQGPGRADAGTALACGAVGAAAADPCGATAGTALCTARRGDRPGAAGRGSEGGGRDRHPASAHADPRR